MKRPSLLAKKNMFYEAKSLVGLTPDQIACFPNEGKYEMTKMIIRSCLIIVR